MWHRKYFSELMTLAGDRGGRQIMEKHRDNLRIVQAEEEELRDIDVREDLPEAGRLKKRRGDENYGSEA